MEISKKSWKTVELGQVVKLINGRAYSQKELLSEGTPIIRIQNLKGGNRWYYSNLKLPEEQHCSSGDLLFAWSATFGPFIWHGSLSIYHYHIWKVKPTKDIDKTFAYYLLENITSSVKAASHGISMLHITKEKMEQWRIDLPPIAEQKRIAAIAQKCDRLRRTRRYTQQLSDSYLRSVFLEMFGDPATNSKGWDLSTIGEMAKVGTGGTPDRNHAEFYGGNIPWVKTGEVTGDVIYRTEEHLTQEGLKSSNCKLFPIGTIIVAMYGQGLTRGRSAKLGIEATTNQACAAILPNSKLSTDYLWSYLKVSYEDLRDLGRGGNQPNLNLDLVKSFRVPLPPLPLQEKFAQIVQRFERLRVQQREADRQAEHLFQTVLHRAFRGEL